MKKTTISGPVANDKVAAAQKTMKEQYAHLFIGWDTFDLGNNDCEECGEPQCIRGCDKACGRPTCRGWGGLCCKCAIELDSRKNMPKP